MFIYSFFFGNPITHPCRPFRRISGQVLGFRLGLAYTKAGLSLAAVLGALNTAAAAAFNANSTAA